MAYTVDIYDIKGKKKASKELNADLYNDAVINEDLIHEYVLLQRANGRIAVANAKTRGEIRGSGKKLYRQKGTGSARVGDKKSPVRRGGGVAFGPTKERNFSKSMNKKMRRRALQSLISLKAKNGEMIGLEGFAYDVPKTKNAKAALEAVGVVDQKVLVLLGEKNEVMAKSFANLPNAKYLLVNYCNPVDLLSVEKVICTEGVVDHFNSI